MNQKALEGNKLSVTYKTYKLRPKKSKYQTNLAVKICVNLEEKAEFKTKYGSVRLLT